MRKIINMRPRSSGKTTMATNDFSKSPSNSILVTLNCSIVNDILNNYLGMNDYNYADNVMSIDRFLELRGRKYDRVIIDEYFSLSLDYKIELYHLLSESNVSELIIYSTPNKAYDREIFKSVTDLKKSGRVGDILNYGILVKDEAIDLIFNFLTDPDTIIKHANPNEGKYFGNREFELIMGTNRYKSEILNEFLKK